MTEGFKNLVVGELVQLINRIHDRPCIESQAADILKKETNEDYREILKGLNQVRIAVEEKKRECNLLINELSSEKKRAVNAHKAKADFLSMISHEIRTPLNAIIGIGHILMNESPRDDQLTYIKSLRWSGESLLALINDVLDFNKIEAGRVEFESIPFNFFDTIQGVKESFVMKANEQGNELILKVEDNVPEFLIGDPTRLVQILNNLLSNAIKFTKKGCVRMDAGVKQKNEQSLILKVEVSDTGVGIAEDKISEIFTHFSQADSRTNRQFGGTGLGLTITKQLIELQGGEIVVESQLGVGSVFNFELPLQIPEQSIILENMTSVHPKDDGIAGIKVLVVEDIAVNRLVVEKFLLDWGVEVDLAENGKEAVHKVITDKYDLILMDLQMPIMDGFLASSEIRKLKRPKYQKVPIVALTAAAVAEIRNDVFEAGMNDIVTKPINPMELYKVLIKHGGRVSLSNSGDQVPEGKTNLMPNQTGSKQVIDQTNLGLLDFSYFNKLAGDDRTFFIRVIHMSIDAFETFKVEYSRSFENRDFNELSSIRHKIIASLNNLKIKSLLDLMAESKRLQQDDRALSRFTITAHVDKVCNLTDKVISELKSQLPSVIREKVEN